MQSTQTKGKRARKNVTRPKPVPARRVQEALLELTYRLHATRPIGCMRRAAGSVA